MKSDYTKKVADILVYATARYSINYYVNERVKPLIQQLEGCVNEWEEEFKNSESQIDRLLEECSALELETYVFLAEEGKFPKFSRVEKAREILKSKRSEDIREER